MGRSAVSVRVRLPTILRSYAAGQSTVDAAGSTVGAVVDDLVGRYPGMAGHLKAPDGGLHRFVNVYVNDEDVRYQGGLEAKVGDGDEVSILPAVAGGSG
jgi:molybdopterin synthase sulfur carrier subunit